MLVDSHCHIFFDQYKQSEIQNVIDRAHDKDVKVMLLVSTKMIDCDAKIIPMVQKYDSLFGSVGVHHSLLMKI